MNYILVCAYANENVLCRSISQLVRTVDTKEFEIHVFDNYYPLNRGLYLYSLCKAHGLKYHTYGKNVGMYVAYAHLIDQLPEDCQKAIFYDADCLPDDSGNWAEALLKVIHDDVVHSTLTNVTNHRELVERGYKWELNNGVSTWVTKDPCTNTVCAFNIPWLRSIGGFKGGNQYYGGNEISMWTHYEGKKWVFLPDYSEHCEMMMPLHDWQYQQYKLLHAHKGLKLSFEEYLKTGPQPQEITI